MEEKKYLKWYNKVGYGTGDLAGNVVYAFLSSFVMLYLTNTVGLNPGVVGTLIMVSKLFDGVSDMFFGTLIDKTKSRLGKARPWMLYAYIGCAVTLVANFAIPESLGKTAQYAWFFLAYTLLNAVFFTANNIAYASLVTFCTKNSKVVPFYFCVFNKSDHSIYHRSVCKNGRRWSCCMENRSNHIRSNRTDCKHNFRILDQRTSGGRIKGRQRTDRRKIWFD